MKDLIVDVGISSDTLEFMNVQDIQKKRETMLVHQSDHSFNYLMNALFTPLDMTNYEDTFVGWNEVEALPINNYTQLKPMMEELWPENHSLIAMEEAEKRPLIARSSVHRDLLEAKAAAAEAGDEGGDEEEEEEGEEGEEGEEKEEAAAEPEAEEDEDGEEKPTLPEVPAYPGEETFNSIDLEDRYFLRGENLRNKFNEVELDSFMKLLNVKPHKQWQDQSLHHYKLGVHTYEDDSQQLDPAFHILGEVERKH
jgi:hypothetical protein